MLNKEIFIFLFCKMTICDSCQQRLFRNIKYKTACRLEFNYASSNVWKMSGIRTIEYTEIYLHCIIANDHTTPDIAIHTGVGELRPFWQWPSFQQIENKPSM